MPFGKESEDIESQLTGRTLVTYWYLLINSEVTVRQLTREMNFSSPSIATHHLNKLQSLNIAEKDETGKYYLTKYIPVGVLQHFIRFRGILLPRMFFLAVFFTIVLLIGYTASKRAGKDTAEFFLGGRGMPWWLLGISMVACTFSADTPNLVTGMVREDGVAKNWAW